MVAYGEWAATDGTGLAVVQMAVGKEKRRLGSESPSDVCGLPYEAFVHLRPVCHCRAGSQDAVAADGTCPDAHGRIFCAVEEAVVHHVGAVH